MGRTRGGLPNLLLRIMLERPKKVNTVYHHSGVCMESESTVLTDDRT
jgi:hypothetical protein